MSAKKKTQPVLEDSTVAEPPSLEKELTDSAKHDWEKLQRLAPLNTGPRMLYVLVDSPPLRRRLAEQLEASLQRAGHPVVRFDFIQPYYQPLQEIFAQAEQHPHAKFFSLFGLERSLLSSEHRISALTDLNFHRDQISKRLPCPLMIWIPDETFTDLLINAPDFTAWRGGVFNITDEASERETPYRQHIIEQFGKLTLYSTTADAPLAVDLEQVFVKLTATQRRRTMTVRSIGLWRNVEEFLQKGVDETAEFSPSKKGINPPHPQAPQESELAHLEESTVTLSLAEALHDNQCLAVIGAPGSGKTTLLKYLALSFARHQAHERLELAEDRLPILVYLRDFGPFLDTAAQQEDGVSLLLHFLSVQYQKTAAYLNLPNDFFSRQMEAGHCIVLLDGLDEVLDSQKRSRVIDMISALASRYPGNRFIVTSRPRGYEGDAKQRLSPLYAECTIRDFDDADTQAFARSWYTAVTIDRQGDTPTVRTTAVMQADDLLRAIRADERVKALAHNPLLLSVLAMVHQRGVGLPQRRAELYDECTDMLLGYWDQSKGGEAARELANLGALDRTEKRALLEPIALWFHERGEHSLEATKDELEEKIAEQFTEIFGDTPEKARSRAELSLRVIDERAGLLVERASGVYAFAHLTFQEYLAARAIADREDYIAYTLKRLHKPWWREVILLEVGHLSDQRYFGRRTRKLTSDLLRAIRNAGSWLEDVLNRDLLFAARCLCDTGPLSIDDELRQSLISALILLWRTTPYDLQQQEVVDVFTLMMTTANGKRIQAELLLSLNGQEESERARALSATENIGASINMLEITNSLLSLIRTAKSAKDQAKTARALGRVGPPEIVHEEIQRQLTLTMSGVMEERLSAVKILSAFGKAAATEAVVRRLLDLAGDQNREVRASAIIQLGIKGEEALTSTVVEQLPKLLYDSEDHIPVAAALGMLGERATEATRVAQRILTSQTEDGNQEARFSALCALTMLVAAGSITEMMEEKILDQLLALTSDPEMAIRILAVHTLKTVAKRTATAEIVEHLLMLTDDPANGVRSSAIEALGEVGVGAITDVALERLFTLAVDSEASVRTATAWALGHICQRESKSTIIHKLLALSSDPEAEVRATAAWALGEINAEEPKAMVREQLFTLINDADERVRCTAALMLNKGATLPAGVESHLVEFWLNRKMESEVYNFRGLNVQVCNLAYAQLQRLAELREQQATTDERTPGHEVSGLHDRAG